MVFLNVVGNLSSFVLISHVQRKEWLRGIRLVEKGFFIPALMKNSPLNQIELELSQEQAFHNYKWEENTAYGGEIVYVDYD